MDWKLELVAIPVSDVDRAKAFYSESPASTSRSCSPTWKPSLPSSTIQASSSERCRCRRAIGRPGCVPGSLQSATTNESLMITLKGYSPEAISAAAISSKAWT